MKQNLFTVGSFTIDQRCINLIGKWQTIDIEAAMINVYASNGEAEHRNLWEELKARKNQSIIGDIVQYDLKRSFSNHTSIILSSGDTDWGPRSFKFINARFENEECENVAMQKDFT
ncbi:hypothetical protein V6N13_050709 [Hibiscus sabdariffa]